MPSPVPSLAAHKPGAGIEDVSPILRAAFEHGCLFHMPRSARDLRDTKVSIGRVKRLDGRLFDALHRHVTQAQILFYSTPSITLVGVAGARRMLVEGLISGLE